MNTVRSTVVSHLMGCEQSHTADIKISKPYFRQQHVYSKNGDVKWVPFKYTQESFIIRKTDKYEMLVDTENKPVHCGSHLLHKNREGLPIPKNPYAVCCPTKGNKSVVFQFSNILDCLSFCWHAPKVNQNFNSKTMDSIDLTPGVTYKILKPVLEFLEDREYNRLVGAKPQEIIIDPVVISQTLDVNCDSELLYQEFEHIMDIVLSSSTRQEWMGGSNCTGTLECVKGEELILCSNKRQLSFEYLREVVHTNGFPSLVSRFIKPGSVTSSGRMRNIYPMNILYETALRLSIDNRADLDWTGYTYAKGRDFGEPLKYTYDVRGCDRRVMPYVSRYALARGKAWLVPKVHDNILGQDNYGYPDQFPSGVYHTSLITRVFTTALLKCLGVRHAVIQGDGFSCDVDLEHEYIRKVPDFNGFVYKNGVWCYDRAARLLEGKYLRGSGPTGVARYQITKWAYEYLGGDTTGFPRLTCGANVWSKDPASCIKCRGLIWCGLHFEELDDAGKSRLVGRIYSDLGHIVKIVLEENGVNHDTRCNNWDTLKRVLVSQGVRKGLRFERLFL